MCLIRDTCLVRDSKYFNTPLQIQKLCHDVVSFSTSSCGGMPPLELNNTLVCFTTRWAYLMQFDWNCGCMCYANGCGKNKSVCRHPWNSNRVVACD
jgi:hypothetical protein